MSAAPEAGLAAERTALAWSRTSLALLANGGLVLLRHLGADGRRADLVLAAAALVLAAGTALLGRWRGAQLRDDPVPRAVPAVVHVLGAATVLLCVATTLSLLR